MELVKLKGGLSVPEDVLAFVIDLDLKGVSVAVKDGRLFPSPAESLTEADIAFLKAHRWHVLALASYEPLRARA